MAKKIRLTQEEEVIRLLSRGLNQNKNRLTQSRKVAKESLKRF